MYYVNKKIEIEISFIYRKLSDSHHCHPAVDVQRLSGDVFCLVACKENNGGGDVFRCAHDAHWDR